MDMYAHFNDYPTLLTKDAKINKESNTGAKIEKESDPTGLDASDAGAKLDAGKIRFSLVPILPFRLLAKLYTRGAEKYSDHGWKDVENGKERYLDALYRHLSAYQSGEYIDKETQLPHLISVAWNAFAIVWLHANNKG